LHQPDYYNRKGTISSILENYINAIFELKSLLELKTNWGLMSYVVIANIKVKLTIQLYPCIQLGDEESITLNVCDLICVIT